MKFVIYDNFLDTPMEGRGAPGGLEKVAKDDAFNLTKAGHEVLFLYTGKLTEHQFPFRAIQIHSIPKEQLSSHGMSETKWQNECVANTIRLIEREKPDAMLYHSHKTSPAKRIIKATGIPTLLTLHGFLTGNLFIDTGRITAYQELYEMGAYIVTNTQATGERLYSQAKLVREKYVKNDDDYRQFVDIVDQRLPFYDDHHRNFMFVEERYEIKESEGCAIIASRADPLKLVHKFKDIQFPTFVFWKNFPANDPKYPAWLEKQRVALEANENIALMMNRPYAEIMYQFSKSKVCIISWPDETFGLTAFEAAQKGVPSICFHKGETSCTAEFLSRVQAPFMIDYREKDWETQVVDALKNIDDSLENRQDFANRFAQYFSYQKWLDEKMVFIFLAIAKMKTAPRVSTNLFDFT